MEDPKPTTTDWPDYLTAPDAVRLAATFGITVAAATLANWRTHGRLNDAPAPSFYKARSGACFYPKASFIRWCEAERGPLVTRAAERSAA